MKYKVFIGLFLILILLANISFASYSTVTMSVVEEPVCTISLGGNSKFEKKLISKDLVNKEVTLQLKVSNEEIIDKPTGEIVLVIDTSGSMTSPVTDDLTRRDLVFEATKNLISTLLQDNDQLKIGLVTFSSKTGTEFGSEADAQILSNLSNSVSDLTGKISEIELVEAAKTNLDSGLTLGNTLFTKEDNQKYMIVLTDGIPNIAINNKVMYSNEVFTKTKQDLENLINQGVKLITMLTGITEDVRNNVPGGSKITNQEIIEKVFGTPEKPTASKFYDVQDEDAQKTIEEDIAKDLIPLEKTFKDITVVDYFPDEIVKNFDFAYISDANIGEISSTIDTKNNSITWTIPELAAGETATVEYKLKLKQNFDESIIDKILNTNEKVDLDYTNLDGKPVEKTSDISPKLLLEQPPVELPKAGTLTLIGFAVLATVLFTYSAIKLIVIHNKMN